MRLKHVVGMVWVFLFCLSSTRPLMAQVGVRVERNRYPESVPGRSIEIEATIRLMEHPQTRYAKIDALVRDGALYLNGRVSDEAARRVAEDLVIPVAAGLPVRNELETGAKEPPRPAPERNVRLQTRGRELLDKAAFDFASDLWISSFGNVLVVEGMVPDSEARLTVSETLRPLAAAQAIRNVTYVRNGGPPPRAERGTRVSVPLRIGNLFGVDLEIGSRRGMNLDVWAAGYPTGVYLDWSRQGPSDQELAEAFRVLCEQDGRVRLDTMRYRVETGVLFLEGTLPSQATRMRAVSLARQVGMRGLVDGTELAPNATPFAPAYHAVHDVERYLEYYLATRAGVWHVDVHEHGGRIGITGNVLTSFHDETARAALADLPGFKELPVAMDLRVVRPRGAGN